MVNSLREIAGRDFQPAHVGFTLTREPDQREFARFFGCPVEFSGTADQFSPSNETLAIPLVTRDQHLLETLQPIREVAAKEQYGLRDAPIFSRERSAEIAAARQSQQADDRQGAGADRANARAALQYIKEPGVSVAQIAWLLGYEGPTSFNHAFARWTGRSASEARSENRLRNDGQVSKLSRAP
jgi:AraC-like DNA-binding protein